MRYNNDPMNEDVRELAAAPQAQPVPVPEAKPESAKEDAPAGDASKEKEEGGE
jgi:hypothetical protein